jgi:hypothetical protein
MIHIGIQFNSKLSKSKLKKDISLENFPFEPPIINVIILLQKKNDIIKIIRGLLLSFLLSFVVLGKS